ncbi:MAG: hypothetical protein IPM98_06600 [Lewinellaceae bacterium]|nr:hypothetical protein [Lewinellaceae bacterium]
MEKNFFAVFSLFCLLFACKTETRCRYKPEPIFAADLPHIVQYNFEKQGNMSLESLVLDTRVLLEIEQKVCNETRQDFRFTVQGDFSSFPDSMWLKEAVRQLVFLSTFSPKQAPLKAWADALEQERVGMRLGEERAIQPGVAVSVDRIISPEKSTLILVLAQAQ